ncbi:class I SAM-dependent methyltransferase [Leifsonia aquatica]|uniref:Methyltransferase domain protein n=2 Tax=Leifsonia aquatica TaxID=144185 RepID=U2RQK0_LEIAQ|nr:class I SAM-dependent methyltransferase [Leifsonia aquatica]ERK70869.1 methyltransferase domain protein [Leifsonia aquatica ATCC 14665]MBB2968902.1 SAM-dependent methyltransferase [Leifsonia aquatica]
MTASTTPSYLHYGADFADIYDTIFPRTTIGPGELAWLSGHVGGGKRVLELGVGTGRVALPLAERLAEGGQPVEYHGIDISTEMLAQLEDADTAGRVTGTRGDIVYDHYGVDYDIILCVCATISMITKPDDQARVFVNAAKALRPGGTLIVETHNAEFVQSIHGPRTDITYAVPYPDGKRALVSFSTLDHEAWTIDHCWIDNGTTRFVSETSRVTTLRELDTYATNAGLTPGARTSGLNGAPISRTSGTITVEYSKPSENAQQSQAAS